MLSEKSPRIVDPINPLKVTPRESLPPVYYAPPCRCGECVACEFKAARKRRKEQVR